MPLKRINQWSKLEEWASDWNRLAEISPAASVFQTFEWHRAWWKAFGQDQEGAKLSVSLVLRDGKLAAVAPFMVRRGVISFIGSGNHASDYCDVLVDPSYPEALEELMNAVISERTSWRRVELRNLRSHSPHRKRIQEFFEARGLGVITAVSADAPTRILGDKASDHEAVNKKSLKRHTSHFRSSGKLEFKHCKSVTEVQGYLDQFFEQHQGRRALAGDGSLFDDPKQKAFYRQVAREFVHRDWLRFGVVLLDGEPLAFHFGFEFCDRFYWYKPAFDAKYAKKSPGEVLLKFLLEYAIDKRLSEFDFTVGSEGFKYRFANEIRTNLLVIAFASKHAYWLHRFVRLIKRLVKQLLRKQPQTRSSEQQLS